MLKVQTYLRSGKTLEDLKNELRIEGTHHVSLPLVILNYNQIESSKTHPIVRECRGLVLNKEDWSIVAKSMDRFFNWGEVADEMPLFNWPTAQTTEKQDGSLVLFYFFNGEWHANTRGSFAAGPMFNTKWQANYHKLPQSFTWKEGILKALGVGNLSELNLDPSLTYVGEFCSLWNKVVREYVNPCIYLLTCFAGEEEVGRPASPFKAIQCYPLVSADDVIDYVSKHPEATFEGCVVKDNCNRRWKIKNPRYLSLHKMKGGNGEALYKPSTLLPFILKGEGGELLAVYEEVTEVYHSLEYKINEWKQELDALWQQFKDEPTQKDYALKVKDHFLSAIMFQASKERILPSKLFSIKNLNLLLKHL